VVRGNTNLRAFQPEGIEEEHFEEEHFEKEEDNNEEDISIGNDGREDENNYENEDETIITDNQVNPHSISTSTSTSKIPSVNQQLSLSNLFPSTTTSSSSPLSPTSSPPLSLLLYNPYL